MAILNPTQLGTASQTIADETTAGANTAARIGGMFQDIVDSGVYTVKVSLTSAEILALADTPITLIAAQGASTLIKLLGCTMKLNYVSTTYTGGTLRIYFSSGGSFIISNSSYTNGSSIIFTPAFSTTQVFTTSAENDDLIIDAASAVSVGDGTLDIYLTYSVIEL